MTFPEDLLHLVRTDVPLGPLVWLGIGGPARYFAEPVDTDELKRVYQVASKAGLAVKVLGGGSNVLVRESGFDGLVISLAAANMSQLTIDENRMTVGGGAKLSHAVIKAVGSGLALKALLVGPHWHLDAAGNAIDFWGTKTFWTMGNHSRFIRPGGNDGW